MGDGTAVTSTVALLQPGQRIRPQVSLAEATALARRLYGVHVTSIKELDSYDDRNFCIRVSTEHENPHIRHVRDEGYILKVLNKLDSQNQHVHAELEFQRLLGEHGIACPQPVLNVHGKDCSLEELPQPGADTDDSCSTHVIRLLTFVPGKVLDTVVSTPHLLHNVGYTVGAIHRAVKGWSHDALRGHQTIWSLSAVPALRQFLYAVEDTARQHMVAQIITAFENQVLSCEAQFRRSVIHGDPNEQNLLVREVPQEDGRVDYEVSGILDFGDMADSYAVYDLALAVTYMMISTREVPPLEAAGHAIAGYLQQQPITYLEWSLLKVIVAGRFCQSLVLGAYSYSLDPGNEYLLTTSHVGWGRLEQLWRTPTEQLQQQWRDIVDSHGVGSQLPTVS